ncbi:hypothetical protein ACA910_016501 [Epithemia clementina (nom. ined.)]
MTPSVDEQRVVVALTDIDRSDVHNNKNDGPSTTPDDSVAHTHTSQKASVTTAEATATTSASAALENSSSSREASMMARYTCASIVIAIFGIWGKLTFVTDGVPGGTTPLHNWKIPLGMNLFYLVSLPLLRLFTAEYLSKTVDVKSLLKESMLLYNVGQVVLNGWMVYAFVKAVAFNGHPIIGGARDMVETGVTYAVWVHYCNKYLEYLDTYFMVLRGRMDQVSFLHVYHHTSISAAWWFGLKVYPGGDAYFGALLNSFIHVLMYSYYAMALLKIRCPWKKYLTLAQLVQFTAVLLFSFAGIVLCCGSDNISWEQNAAHFVQDFEMTSLFILFMAFYRKTYTKRGDSSSSNGVNVPISTNNKLETKVAESDLSDNGNEDASVDSVISASTDSSMEERENDTSTN